MSKPKAPEPEESSMGFKDKQKALDTLKALDERDISYQYHVITSFVGRAKRTVSITKDQEKLANIREAQQVFEDWLTDYKHNNRGKENLAYLPLATVDGFRPLAKKYEVLDESFYKAYSKENGDYKALRAAKTPSKETTWDIERNRRLKEIISKIKTEHIQWFETDAGEFRGFPTKEHTQCVLLGYSPEPTKLKKLIPQVEEKFGKVSDDENMDTEEGKREKGVKRRRYSTSDSDSESDEPKSKTAKKEEEPEIVEKDRETGLSFKDKQRAIASLKFLEGRDILYQYHAITGLVKRAERVISCTKDSEKIKNFKEAVGVYENWITDYKANNRSAENFGYLSLDIVRAYQPLADKYGMSNYRFLKAYEKVEGDYKRLRSVKVSDSSETTWDVERNNHLREHLKHMKEKNVQWYHTDPELDGVPTEEHTDCIMWGFSHDPAKVKKLVPTLNESFLDNAAVRLSAMSQEQSSKSE